MKPTDFKQLKEPNLYSILLFALYQLKNCPDYAVLSQLMFMFDSTSLLKLCSQFGGTTITIPTVQELNEVLEGLNYYYSKDIQHENVSTTPPQTYYIIKDLLDGYFIEGK